MNKSLKTQIEYLAKSIWKSEELQFMDSERTRGLRHRIIRDLLSLSMTDDERARMLGLPEGCRVRESAKVISPENLNCGEYVWIGENSVVDASGGLTIGAHTTVAVAALIWSHESVLANLMMTNTPGNPYIVRMPTVIGSGCYIGGPSSIYPGITIGNHVVVLPMSVVTADVPDNVVVGGSPARVVRKIDDAWLSNYCAKHRLHSRGQN